MPIFVDAWAPWCHTCLSMRAYVFSDARLRPIASHFVWLAIDTEREANAPIVTRLGVKVLPTLFVIDPASEETRLAHEGSLTAPELAQLLEGLEPSDALAHAAPSSPSSPSSLAGRVARLNGSRQFGPCVTLGADEAPRMPPGTALADVLRSAIDCARSLPAEAPERGRLAALVETGERVVSDPNQPILADDRSDLYDYLVDAFRRPGPRRRGETAGGRVGRVPRRPGRPCPLALGAHGLRCASAARIRSDRGARARRSDARAERTRLPGRLQPARSSRESTLRHEALRRREWPLLERALKRAYGPRKLRLWSLEADVLVAKGNPSGAREALQSALDFAATVPLTGAYPRLRDALEQRRDALATPPAH